MKYRKQTQHWRRYRSGKYKLINRGIKYRFTKEQELNLIAYNLFGRTILDLTEDEKQAVEEIYKKKCKRYFGSQPEIKEVDQILEEIKKLQKKDRILFAKIWYQWNKQKAAGLDVQRLRAGLDKTKSIADRERIKNIIEKRIRESRSAWDQIDHLNKQLPPTYQNFLRRLK